MLFHIHIETRPVVILYIVKQELENNNAWLTSIFSEIDCFFFKVDSWLRDGKGSSPETARW